MRNHPDPQHYQVKGPLHFRGKAVVSPHRGRPCELPLPLAHHPGTWSCCPTNQKIHTLQIRKVDVKMFEGKKKELLLWDGGCMNLLLRLRKGVCV